MNIINNKEDMEGMIEKLEESNLIEDVYTLTKAYLIKKIPSNTRLKHRLNLRHLSLKISLNLNLTKEKNLSNVFLTINNNLNIINFM